MYKENLWCGYCRNRDFTEHPDSRHPDDQRYSSWECSNCHAVFEDNSGYGYFTTDPGVNGYDTEGKYSLATGKPLDSGKLPRTPEGIVRHSGNKEELESYLKRTQIQ